MKKLQLNALNKRIPKFTQILQQERGIDYNDILFAQQ